MRNIISVLRQAWINWGIADSREAGRGKIPRGRQLLLYPHYLGAVAGNHETVTWCQCGNTGVGHGHDGAFSLMLGGNARDAGAIAPGGCIDRGSKIGVVRGGLRASILEQVVVINIFQVQPTIVVGLFFFYHRHGDLGASCESIVRTPIEDVKSDVLFSGVFC